MTPEQWQALLTAWSTKVMAYKETLRAYQIDPHCGQAIDAGTCLSPPAASSEITALEQHLGIVLPKSYTAFLLASNGFCPLTESIRLLPTGDVHWLKDVERNFVAQWTADASHVPDEAYFIYGSQQDQLDIRTAYLKSALRISSNQDGYMYLLISDVQTADGEWEAWDFGTKLCGAIRYRTFAELMQAKLARLDLELSAL